MEAIAFRVEAILGRLEAIASRVEAIACRVEVFACRVEAIAGVEAIASGVEAIAFINLRRTSINFSGECSLRQLHSTSPFDSIRLFKARKVGREKR